MIELLEEQLHFGQQRYQVILSFRMSQFVTDCRRAYSFRIAEPGS
jgi:hypothetical protein